MARRVPALIWLTAVVLSTPVAAQDDAPKATDDEQVPSDEQTPASDTPKVADDEEVPADSEQSPADDGTHPPHIVDAPPPVYPPGRENEGLHPTVVLRVTIGHDATITDVVVEHSAGPDFDQAAVEAVKRWTFEPATKDGVPVTSRVRVAVHFEPPDLGTPHEGDTHEPQPTPHVEEPKEPVQEVPTDPTRSRFRADAEVDPEKLRARDRSASDFSIDQQILKAAPRAEAADLLKSAPGVYIARGEGDAVAHNIYLRGFDAEHGQDIELTVGGIPINQPAHLHGQGYADLGFIIPEVVRELRVVEGVYDPRQGDFAVAGSIDFNLGVEDRGLYWRSSYGSFRTFRQLALWAPEGKDPDTFGAVQFRRTSGFGQNRGGRSGSGIFQYGFGRKRWRFRVHGMFHGARSNIAGVLRVDDIEAGEVGFYDVYPFPTAQAQNAFSARAQIGFTGEHRGEDGKNSSLNIWLQLHEFRLQQNFTGFVERSQVMPDFVGRGDLIEQRDRRLVFGGMARHRTAGYRPWSWLTARFELGMSGRLDLIDQQQNLLQAPQNQTWDQRVDANITGGDVGAWADVDLALTDYVDLRGGARVDFLFYSIDDKLGNFIPDFRADQFIIGFRRSAAGIAAGPRASLTIKPLKWLDILAAYGEGFRSPQARTLADGETAPFTKVRSADVGLRARAGKNDEFEVTLTGYRTWLDDDVAFEASEGRLERIGPTTRLGATLYTVAKPWQWLVASASVTYVKATLDAPPPPSREDPSPPFTGGERLPFVPPWVVRIDIGANHKLADLGEKPLMGRLGVGYTFLSERPLPFSQFANRVSLFDMAAGLSWRNFELGVDIFNLFDDRYAAVEYSFVSNWDPSALPSRIPARHIAAGAPRTVMFTLGVRL